jgi:alpha-tubulin suppressor-like RCC1 family protein
VPTPVPGLTGVVALEAGAYDSCALLDDGSAACWGDNQDQVLGRSSLLDMSSTPLAMTGLSAVSEVSVGAGHACALLADGTVRCWGNNYYGQLGDDQPQVNSPDPVEVVGITDAVAVAAGTGSSCAVVGGGAVRCWGRNSSGVPVAVLGIDSAVNVACGEMHACALLSDGTVRCWGGNEVGALGNGLDVDSNVPVHPLL